MTSGVLCDIVYLEDNNNMNLMSWIACMIFTVSNALSSRIFVDPPRHPLLDGFKMVLYCDFVNQLTDGGSKIVVCNKALQFRRSRYSEYLKVVPNKIMFAASLDTSDADMFMEIPKSAWIIVQYR